MNPLLSKLYPELDGILGGSARTASWAARQPEEPKYEFTPEDERSLLGTLRDKSIGGLAAVGNLLDVPGSMVRDVATWLPGGPKPTNPFDQLLSPMSSDNRTTGRDLARGYGLASKKDTWGNFGGGLAAEIALDPLTYLTLGASALSKTGQAAKAAGLSDDLLKVAARKAGKKVGDVGKREARLTTTLDDFIKYGDEATQLKASELAKTHASDEAMGGLFGYNKPFSAPSGVLGTGDMAVKIAKKMDDIGGAIHYGKIPGTEFAPIAAGRSLLDATVAGATDKWKSNVNRQAFRAKEKAAGLARAESAFQMQKLVDAGAGEEDITRIIRMMVEKVDPTSSPGVAHMAKPWADAQADPKKWGAINEVAQRHRDIREGMNQAEGLANATLDDQMVEYAHRALTSDSKWKASREKRVAGGSQSSDMGRIDSIRDVPGGTEAVSYLAKDFLNEMRNGTLKRPDLKVKHIEKWLESKHAWLGDEYRTSKVVDEPVIDATTGLQKMKEGPLLLDPQGNPYIDPATRMPARGPSTAVTRKVKKLVPTKGRFNALARDLASMSDETLEKGIFGNHVVRDMESRMLSHQATVASRDAFTDALSQPGILNATSKNARSKKGENVSLARLAADLGYKTGDENSGIVRLIQEQAGKTQGNPLASMDVRDIRKMTVPKDVAEGMRNYVKLTENPEALDEILGAVDSVVNFSKGMWTSPWLAFHGRNTLSGSVHNFLKGMWDRKSFADSNAISKGRVIKDLDKEEWIQKEWAKDWAARGVPAPSLDELEANKFLGRLLYKHQVVGRHNSEAQSIVGKAVSKEDIHSGTLQDLRNSVPGPGVESFNVARTAKKYFGATPETTLDPRKATIRGVRGATESTFGPMAAGEELGKYAEDLNRITPFLNLARKGTNLDEAAKQVHVAQVQYGNKNYTPFEQQTMARLFPFFKFSKGVVPQIVKELMERPGGKLGALIRTQRSMQESGPLAPDYVRESASIPVNGLLGTPPEGTDRYITGLGLMHENPFAFGTTARSAGLELLSRMTPAIKAPLEWFTGQSFFQKGPDGGRKLDDMDPILGRLASNFGLTDNPKGFAPDWIEQTVANSPVSVGLSKLKQFTDERKALGTGVVTKHIPGPAAALNLLTGINVTDVSPGSKDAILRDLLNDEMKGAGAGAFERIYFRKEDLEKMTPQERLNANKLQALANMLVKRAKERKLVKASESR